MQMSAEVLYLVIFCEIPGSSNYLLWYSQLYSYREYLLFDCLSYRINGVMNCKFILFLLYFNFEYEHECALKFYFNFYIKI